LKIRVLLALVLGFGTVNQPSGTVLALNWGIQKTVEYLFGVADTRCIMDWL